MSGFVSHLFSAFLQQLLLIVAVAAAGLVWLRHRAATRSRMIRVPVQSRRVRSTNDWDCERDRDGHVTIRYGDRSKSDRCGSEVSFRQGE